MKISKTSWHYRWIIRLLCWTDHEFVVGNSKRFGWALFPLTFFKLFGKVTPEQSKSVESQVPRSLCTYFWTGVFLTFLAVAIFPLSLVVVVVAIIPYTVLLGVALAILALHSVSRRQVRAIRQARAVARGDVEPEPSLVLEFIKAKKRRVCPLLQYVD